MAGAARMFELDQLYRAGRRAATHRTAPHIEAAAVPWAGDAVAVEVALVQRTTAMRTAARQRDDTALGAEQEERDVAHVDPHGTPRLQVGRGRDVRPLVREALEHRVDADAQRVGQMAAEPAAGTEQARTGDGETHSPAATPAHQPARAVQRQGRGSQRSGTRPTRRSAPSVFIPSLTPA